MNERPTPHSATQGTPGTDHPPTTAQPHTGAAAGGKGRMRVGPTSEATRRLVAEARLRQGLPPTIDNPDVIASLALFLRNALATLPEDDQRDAA
ncbi:hypothetical protein ACFOS0_34435 [Nocardia seriolae]|uniref:hypothetical protein n=2 Tax=Nocardia seriolae TaxID=37332 RepID=UPI001192F276|nr:hypothetical protein [Nocardia seriolae]GEM27070.1 hypothetical protein NS2_53090 [Nocardia seriolae NBRC 15557]